MTTPPSDQHKLLWKLPLVSIQDLPPLPQNITRHFISTPNGKLEILSALPPSSIPSQSKALLFLHGGFGHATVWLPYLSYFSSRGFRCYALSVRGHGASWKPGFFHMVWRTGKRDMAEDLGYGLTWVSAFEAAMRRGGFEEEDLVLIGHSAGGGLSQQFLSEGLGTVGGLVIMAGVPCFGALIDGRLSVYAAWFRIDPWFPLRYFFRDFLHPRSPLSSTTLVHRAFFSPEYPVDKVRTFSQGLAEYESMLWPTGMMFSFANPTHILKNILGSNKNQNQRKLLIIAGEKDALVTLPIMQRLAGLYQKAARKLVGVSSPQEKEKEKGKEGEVMNGEDIVGLEVVKKSGHHIQNDLYWEDGAKKILEFVEQL
ncbi:hypothetical protein HYFRA_00007439 [Hymenoscyphus fraxineus]|uniref:AB hydrolase-1 domain-containing protein n=1 Tax=Hymenoscyphus fraxineus TaxID=746836 RepID=A0A9N9KRT1_9HELO|nr:hypothetical protein HYFRA_00007439 [Hymenoscyphus fraxineus]